MKTIIIDGIEYNLTPKAPKARFKKDDWVIDKQGIVHQIANVIENVTYHTYGYDIVGGGYFNDNTEGVRLWTIEDTKDGDVLVVGDEDGTGIAICGKNDKLGNNILYCYYDDENGYAINTPIALAWLLHPATKEQRDALMKAMADAGYTFDFEKKELKKINNRPLLSDFFNAEYERGKADALKYVRWSEKDEHWRQKAIDFIKHPDLIKATPTLVKDTIAWLKSLKDKVKPQPKQEWSKEDKDYYDAIIAKLEVTQEDAALTDNQMNFLKSLKPRKQWKPSDEQMEYLYKYTEQNNYDGAILTSLYNDLKQL